MSEKTQKSHFVKDSKGTVEFSTAGGIIKKETFEADVNILDETFCVKFITTTIDDSLPFEFLIGRNLLDQLDAFFFGKKQMFLLRLAQD